MKLLAGWEYDEVFNIVTLDGALVVYVSGLLCLVTVPGFSTLSNIQRGTSEVLKLK